MRRIPRHFAGASLKPRDNGWFMVFDTLYSPAFRRGLIEAQLLGRGPDGVQAGIPRHFAGASLKHKALDSMDKTVAHVFPGISPGPH